MKELETILRNSHFPDSHINSLATDRFGHLYTATPEGSFYGADMRQQLVRGDWARSKAAGNSSGDVGAKLHRLDPQPPVDLSVSHFVASADGSYAVVAGPSNEDEEVTSVAVVELGGCQAGAARDAACECTSVDQDLFSSRPGLRILQIAWHPGSVKHFSILSSDNTFRLYCLDDLTIAEQTFTLQLRRSRGVGYFAEEESEQAAAFAYSQGSLWQPYTVYFLTVSGAIYMLCPVAPFGSTFNPQSARELQSAASASGDPDAPTTAAWLSQAMPGSADAITEVAEQSGRGMQNATQRPRIQPHALQEHSVRLQGPLEVVTPDSQLLSMMQLAGGHDSAASLSHSWCGEDCSVLVVATSGGLVGWHLVAHSPQPEWEAATPNCIVEHDTIMAVKTQVSVAEGCSSELLLMAAAEIKVGGGLGDEAAEGLAVTNPWNVRLLPDPLSPERLFCVHTRGAHVLSAPWLPLLASQLGEPGREFTSLANLRSTSAEEVWAAAHGGPRCVGGAVGGDALTGTALILLLSDGSLTCHWPPSALLPSAGTSGQRDAAAKVEVQLKSMYGDLLRGPRKVDLPVLTRVGAGQPEGQRLLTDSIKALREKHVEFLVPAHHDLIKRLEEAESLAAVQSARSQQLRKAADATEQRSDLLSDRLQRAAKWNENLEARVQLLTELHWSLPHPLTQAEVAFKQQELPSLKEAVRVLAESVKGLKGRADAVRQRRVEKEGAARVLPPWQVKGLRAALGDQAELIAASQQLASAVEAQLEQLQVS